MGVKSTSMIVLFGNAGIGLMVYSGLAQTVSANGRLEVFCGGLLGFMLAAIILMLEEIK